MHSQNKNMVSVILAPVSDWTHIVSQPIHENKATLSCSKLTLLWQHLIILQCQAGLCSHGVQSNAILSILCQYTSLHFFFFLMLRFIAVCSQCSQLQCPNFKPQIIKVSSYLWYWIQMDHRLLRATSLAQNWCFPLSVFSFFYSCCCRGRTVPFNA